MYQNIPNIQRLVSMWFCTLFLCACFTQDKATSKQQDNAIATVKSTLNQHDVALFKQRIVTPWWFHITPATTLNSAAEVSTLWQSKNRYGDGIGFMIDSNRFYKSCYKAIVANYQDNDLVVRCLWLMDIAVERPERMAIASYLVTNFFDYNNPTDDCDNCMPADTVARVTLELANLESQHKPKLAINRLQTLLAKRKADISDWVLVEIYTFLGESYIRVPPTNEQLQAFKVAYQSLHALQLTRPAVKSRFSQLDVVYDKLLAARYRAENPVITDEAKP